MQSVAEIIDLMDGPSAVARLLNLPQTTVASWKTRNSIPVDRWPDVVGAARNQGIVVTYEMLVAFHTNHEIAS